LGALEEAFAADILVTPAGFDPTGGLTPEVAEIVASVDEVDTAARLNAIPVGIEGVGDILAVGVEPDTVDVAVGSFDDVEGSWDRLGPASMAVQRIEADQRGYALGDVLDVEIGRETHPVEIVAIFDFAGDISDTQSYYLEYEWVRSLQGSPRDFTVAVTLASGVDSEQATTALGE